MKLTWKGKWKGGEITVEAETVRELSDALRELSLGKLQDLSNDTARGIPRMNSVEGCADAIRTLIESAWGRQPRSMSEIKDALEANALHFSKGTLSGTLTTMTKRGDLRRLKKGGRWKYFVKFT